MSEHVDERLPFAGALRCKRVNDEMYVACPLCGETLPVKEDKNGRPYFICLGCGLQTFIRSESGVQRLVDLYKTQGVS